MEIADFLDPDRRGDVKIFRRFLVPSCSVATRVQARSALKNGVKLDQQLGVNPYKFGMVGSTDAHTGLATAEEDKFFGKTSSSEPSATRANHPFVRNPKTGLTIFGWETVASGYAGSGRPKTRGRPSGTRCSGANFDGIQVVKGWLDAKGADYARGLEIPTPRWTAYDAKYFNVKMAKEVAMFGQDRAYTSPIWYTPGK